MRVVDNFIDNQWVKSSGTKHLDVVDSAAGDPQGNVKVHGLTAIDFHTERKSVNSRWF